jgi:hypothetical protein
MFVRARGFAFQAAAPRLMSSATQNKLQEEELRCLLIK